MDSSPDWNVWYSTIDFSRFDCLQNGIFSNLIDMAIPVVPTGTKSAIEIGCFPGRFIEYVGQKGYVISGIDTYPRITEVAAWAQSKGRFIGSFEQKSLDEFACSPRGHFDAVISLGFLEHFTDFCSVLYDHAKLCEIGGRILIGVPNFASPLQRALHSILDNKNLSAHVLEAMYPQVWAVFMASLGVKIEFAGPFGGFDFWSETFSENPRIRLLQSIVPNLAGSGKQLSIEFNKREASYVALVGMKTRELPEKAAVVETSRQCLSLAAELSRKDQEMSLSYSSFISSLCN